MAAKAKKAPAKAPATKASDVAAFMRTLKHPLKVKIEAVRHIILGVSPSISEGVKWNAPSFRTAKDWFATIHVRKKESVQVILFVGVKKRPDFQPFKLPDPDGLLKWLAEDRALVTLGAGGDIADNRKAFEAIVRAWISHL